MKTKLIGGFVGTAISSMGLVISTEQLEQIVSIVCSVVGVIIVITTSIIIPLIQWHKKAKADGKITQEELDEAHQIITNGVNDVKDTLDKNGKEK